MYFDQAAFGTRLKELRTERGFSQEELAEKLNVSTKHYGHLEQGRKGCSVDFLLELADFFHVSTDYLLGKTEYSHINDGNLSPVENEMLGYYRKLSDSRKHEVLGEIRHIYRADKKPDK